MANYPFLHNLNLLENFKDFRLSKNIAMMHNTVALHELKILDLIQLTFDWERSWNPEPRYEISTKYQEEHSYKETWSLLNIDSNWNRENIQKGAEFLSQNLDYLPEFIIDSAFTIMGECMGYKVCDRNFIIPKNDTEYKEFLELGKCHLAVLMMIIEELGKLGIDCRAIKISTAPFFIGGKIKNCFDSSNYISEIKKIFKIEEFFYSEAFRHLSSTDFYYQKPKLKGKEIISKAFYFETDKMYRQLKFNDLEEFLEMLLKSIDRICTFSSEMINPDSLDFSKYYYPNEALPNSYDLPIGELIDVKECLSLFLKKLKAGEFIKAYYDIKEGKIPPTLAPENNNESTELSNNKNISIDPNLLKDFIKYLLNKNYIQLDKDTGLITASKFKELTPNVANAFYEEAKQSGYYPSLTIGKVNIMIEMIISFIKINVTNIFVNVNPANNEKDNLIDELVVRVQNLENNQATLKERVDNISDDILTLKEQVALYLETGANKPNFECANKEQILQIIREYKAETIASKIRKRLLIASLVLGSLAILNSSAARVSTGTTENLETPPTPVEDTIRETPTIPNDNINIEPVEKFSMHIYEENEGKRSYYTSIYDNEATGMTEQSGIVIRYFAFQNGNLVASIATEEELRIFIENNNAEEYIWKSAISCLDYQALASYIEQGLEIPLQYTTFFTDYTPSKTLAKERK